jgi:hypothetical protein
MKRKIANDECPWRTMGECVSAPTRELAQRLSGAVEVLLLWQREIDRVELSVRDLSTGAGFHLEVAPANAIDAFYHPVGSKYTIRQSEPTNWDPRVIEPTVRRPPAALHPDG